MNLRHLLLLLIVCGFTASDMLQAQNRRFSRQAGTPAQSTQRMQQVVPPTTTDSPLTVANALSFALDPRSNEVKNAKGNHLIRRISLLDSVPDTKNMQIAFVIDGTDSMGMELDGVKRVVTEIVSKIRDIQRAEQPISLSLVVYRDTGAASKGGEILIPSTEFIQDYEAFQNTVAGIKVVGGEPYFPESVDLGAYRAIHDLAWTVDGDTERWIILIGDAPPFPEGFNERSTGARRSHPTGVLIRDAKEKGIKISGIVCSSGFVQTTSPSQRQLQATYQQLLPDTRAFFNALYKGTSGCTMIDLSDELTQKTLLALFKDPPQLKIEPISLADVEAKRREIAQFTASNSINVVVTPFSFIDQSNANVVKMENLPQDEWVAIAVPLRDALQQIPSVAVADFYSVQYRTVSYSNDQPSIKFNSVGNLKNFDNTEWFVQGDVQKRGDLERIRVSLIHRDDPDTPAATYVYSGSMQSGTPKSIFQNLMADLREKRPNANLLAAYGAVDESQDIWTQYSNDVRTRRAIAQAVMAMECAICLFNDELEYSKKVMELMKKAENYLLSALEWEPNNPYAHSLLANCYFNQIDETSTIDQIVNESQNVDKTASNNARLNQKVLEHARKANANKELCVHPLIKAEIEADYALFYGDFATAVMRYQDLTRSVKNEKDRNFAVRAHWALAGIFAGDWGADTFVDATAARNNVVGVFALDESSHQGVFFRRMLEWNDVNGTQHPYIRKTHYAFAALKTSGMTE